MKKKLIGKIELIFMVIIIACIVGQVWLDLELPGYMSEITRLVRTSGTPMSSILRAGGKMLLCALGSAAFAIVISFCAAQLSARITMKLREKIYDKVTNIGIAEVKKFSTASLITRTTNDVRQVAMLILFGLQISIKAPIMAVWAILKISGKSWQWSAATGVAVFVMIISFIIVVLLVVPKFKKIQAQTDSLNRISRENLNGIRVVHAFNAEKYQEDKFNEANKDLTKTNLFVQRITSIISPFMGMIMNGLSIAIYLIGAILINNAGNIAKLTLFGDMVVFSSYAMQIVMAFMLLALISFMLPRAIVSIKRINQVLKTKPSIVNGNFMGETKTHGKIEINQVSFKYPDAQECVLKDISFIINPGETVAIIGSTASGKSTLVNLIARFYDATSGEIKIDGIDVKDYSLNALYSKIGYISQTPTILSGSIYDNVKLGESFAGEISSDDASVAIEIAQAKEFVDSRENGINDEIAQSGANLSGGQKQRLSIARIIARKPEILIFDDSFSALDYKTDRALRRALYKNLSKTTRIIVAQRIGTIKNADKIVVINEGSVVGIGTHENLMNSCEIYKEIALSQLSEEELSNGRK